MKQIPIQENQSVVTNKIWNPYRGRLTRLEFVKLFSIISLLISLPVYIGLATSETGFLINPLFTSIILLVALSLHTPLFARRLHDLGYGGIVYCTLMYIPPLYSEYNLIYPDNFISTEIFAFVVVLISMVWALGFYILLIKKGVDMENRFGKPILKQRSIINALLDR